MSIWLAKALLLVASFALLAIPARIHRGGSGGRPARVVKSAKGPRERLALTLAGAGFLCPFVWVLTPWLGFADYPLRGTALLAGLALVAGGLWLLDRSHRALGASWSLSLEIRERHQLVTTGVYRRVRHPLYLATLVHALGLAIAVPNWIAGPSYLVGFGLLVALRIGPEERLLGAELGERYEAYRAATWRLLPGIW